jgi:hypothetical protein
MFKIFIKSIFSVCYLYMLLFILILLLYKLFLFSPLFLNIILILVLLGIIKDERFSLFRKSVLILLILIQIIIYKYLGFVPILILKDLFWYSVVLNISFIW